MTWLAVTTIGYFLNSIAILMDKILLRKAMPHPAVYAFTGAGLSALTLLLYPFVPGVPPTGVLFTAIIAGALFTLALFAFYWVLKMADASEASPLVGSLTPLASLVFALIILDESLTLRQLGAFLFILAATALLAHEERRRGGAPETRILLPSAGAATLFGLSHVLSAFVYRENVLAGAAQFFDPATHTFLNGVVWRAAGTTLAALAFLIPFTTREYIVGDFRNAKPRTEREFLVGKIAGGASFLLINYAFTLGSVALVNALAGMQYIFLFVLLLFLARRKPHLLSEHLTGRSLVRKTASLALIFAGIVLLSS